MNVASHARRLLFASLALFSSFPSPALLPTGGAHQHAISFQYAHGHLHIVLRHHGTPKPHEAHDSGAPASVVGHDDHADHFLHALPADFALSTSRRSIAVAFLPAVVHGGTHDLPRLAGTRLTPPPLDPQPELAARRTIVLIV